MKLPNGPKLPPLVQMICWVMDPVSYMLKAREHYGEIFTTRLGENFAPLIFVSEPQAIQQIFTHEPQEFEAPGVLNQILQPLLGDNSVIMLDGPRHRRQRQLLMPCFHGERLKAYSNQIIDITQQVMSRLTPHQTFKARSVMQDISLQVILEAVLGLYKKERYQQLKKLIRSLLNLFGSPLTASLLFFPSLQKNWGPWSPWGYFQRIRRQVDELLYAEMAERRQQLDPERADLLTRLMLAVDEVGEPMTDVELRDELLTLLFAGHETTATAMAWSLYWVHHLPKVGTRLLKELDSLGESLDPFAISRLPYLTAVCQETLRIYPVGLLTFGRVVRVPIKLMNYELKPGTEVIICIYLTHHREDLYPQAEQFQPERFLKHRFSPFEFLPFGGGSRRCLGDALAPLEMKLVLATIMSCYRLALANRRPVRPQRRGVTLAPAGGVKMVVIGQRQQGGDKHKEVVLKR